MYLNQHLHIVFYVWNTEPRFHCHETEIMVTSNQYFHDLIFYNCQIRKMRLIIKKDKALSMSVVDTFCDIKKKSF